MTALYDKVTGHRPLPYEPSHLWLVSFTDLIGILLILFVLIFSLSTPVSGLRASVSSDPAARQEGSVPAFKGVTRPDAVVSQKPSLTLGYLAQVLSQNRVVALDPVIKDTFSIGYRGGKLLLARPAEGAFVTFTPELTLQMQQSLTGFAGVMSHVGNAVTIVVVVSEAESDEPWRLGMERADSLSTYLTSVGYEGPVSLISRTVIDEGGQIELLVAPSTQEVL